MLIPAAPINNHLLFICPHLEVGPWASLSKPRASRSLRVFGSAVLSECVTLTFGAGLEKTMAARAIGKWLPGNGGKTRVFTICISYYHLSDVVRANPICYALSARDYPARRHQAPATRAYFRMSSERAFPTRGELWEKRVRRIHPSGASHEYVAASWQSATKMAPSSRDRLRRGTTSPCLANKQPRRPNQRPSKSSWRIRRIPMTRSCSTR